MSLVGYGSDLVVNNKIGWGNEHLWRNDFIFFRLHNAYIDAIVSTVLLAESQLIGSEDNLLVFSSPCAESEH